ncbi:hypothetical protein LS684_10765 [Cytobacillus spongiae]|uniref:hypothetical protein n=1 Tax=Cytobacillus spongiae TaxID=2901381 RepID=UPI001F44C7A7|nr:hypothetical protein [Cytobacillus spongiae]UII54182.1 hypothetical protein LS684_10765 [Cytobacillus spongiae]
MKQQTIKTSFYILTCIFLISILVSCNAVQGEKNEKTTKVIENKSHSNKNDNSIESKNSKTNSNNNYKMGFESNLNYDISEETYKMNPIKWTPETLIAPYYIDDDIIIFIEDLNGKDNIIEFSRASKEWNVLYETLGIGNLTGSNGKIFWTEYDTRNISEVNWTIKSYDIVKKEYKEIRKGGSFKGTPTPTLRIYNDSLNWIEYTTNNSKVTSQLIEYNIEKNETNIIANASLDESKERNGEYFYLQNGAQNGILLYKTLFNNGTKSFDISLYNEESKPISYIKSDRILDFTINENFFVYTGEGYLKANNLISKEEITYNASSMRLTVDSPILFDNHYIIFRFAMNEIYIGDLMEKKYAPITNSPLIVSKPILSNGYIGFATIDNQDLTTFHVLNIKDK